MTTRPIGPTALVALLPVILGCVFVESASAQVLQYPPYGALRGRAVARDGLLHVQRYRWGGGLTPQGAATLQAFVPVFTALAGMVGREVDDAAASRETSRASWAGWEVYAAEQKRATDLLERLERLSAGTSAPSQAGGVPPLSEPQLQGKYGDNPWPAANDQPRP